MQLGVGADDLNQAALGELVCILQMKLVNQGLGSLVDLAALLVEVGGIGELHARDEIDDVLNTQDVGVVEIVLLGLEADTALLADTTKEQKAERSVLALLSPDGEGVVEVVLDFLVLDVNEVLT